MVKDQRLFIDMYQDGDVVPTFTALQQWHQTYCRPRPAALGIFAVKQIVGRQGAVDRPAAPTGAVSTGLTRLDYW